MASGMTNSTARPAAPCEDYRRWAGLQPGAADRGGKLGPALPVLTQLLTRPHSRLVCGTLSGFLFDCIAELCCSDPYHQQSHALANCPVCISQHGTVWHSVA